MYTYLSEIVNDQVKFGLWNDIDQRRQHLKSTISVSENDEIMI